MYIINKCMHMNYRYRCRDCRPNYYFPKNTSMASIRSQKMMVDDEHFPHRREIHNLAKKFEKCQRANDGYFICIHILLKFYTMIFYDYKIINVRLYNFIFIYIRNSKRKII